MDKEDEAEAEIKRIQLISDVNETFASKAGKNVLAKMKSLAYYNIVVKPKRGTDGHIDIYQLVRREAQREIITYIETMLARNPEEKKGIKNA